MPWQVPLDDPDIGDVLVDSCAGVGTAVAVPKISILFDCGSLTLGKEATTAQHVFLSHAHVDHCAAIAAHAHRRSMMGLRPACYYAPAKACESLRGYIAALASASREWRLFARVPASCNATRLSCNASSLPFPSLSRRIALVSHSILYFYARAQRRRSRQRWWASTRETRST